MYPKQCRDTILTVGLTFEKLLIILAIAAFIVGPDRLPIYAQKLAQFVRSLKAMASGAKERMRDEMGEEFDEVDWRKLDPRQYDPRRIIRDALLEDENTPEARRARAAKASADRQAARDRAAAASSVTQGAGTGAGAGAGEAVPAPSASFSFDEEAT